MINRLFHILLFGLSCFTIQAQCPPAGGGIFINEIKAAGQEYIELVVLGDPANPTDPVDLSNWILDDNNIDMAGQGTASGHLILGSTFSSINPGAFILVYNEHIPYAPLPANNPPWVYVVSASEIDGCMSIPNTTNSSYTPCTSGVGNWDYIGLANSGDFGQVRDPSTNYFHGLTYNGVSTIPTPVFVNDANIGLDCGSWFDGANYTIFGPPSPGDFNSPDNETLIINIRNGDMDCNDVDAACTSSFVCPEINDIDLSDASVCENEEFTVTAFDIANMASIANGESDFGINFMTYAGSVPPADPYAGGSLIGTVAFGALMGSNPNQSAELIVAAMTMTPGIYNICAILYPTPAAIVCFPAQCIEIEILAVPIVNLSGEHNFCPGDCHEINVTIAGGIGPYDVDFNLAIGAFSYDFTQESYDINNQMTICYDGGILPIFEASTNTLHVPTFITGSGTLEVLEVRTGNFCKATIESSTLTINLLDGATAFVPTSLELCDDDGDGFMFFDLTTKNNEINGGNGDEVRYYEDLALMNQILPADNYFSNTKLVFAVVVNNNDCISDPVELLLVVLPEGNEGEVNIFCGTIGNKICEFCSVDAQDIEIIFSFQNTGVFYDVEMEYGNSTNGYNTFAQSNVTDGDSFIFTVSEDTEFILISITRSGECADNSDLGDNVEVHFTAGPDLDVPLIQVACDSVILAAIGGIDLSGNESYYTLPNGMGTAILPGTVFYISTTLYVYDIVDDCADELLITVDVVDQITFDAINDINNCGYFILPEITGIGLTGNEAYYSGSNGAGIKYLEGDTIFTTIDLFVFDPSAACLEGEVNFTVDISAGPVFINPGDTVVCSIFILDTIIGVDLNGSELYNTQLDLLGDTLYVGDTIVNNTRVYIYASSGVDCIAIDSFDVIIHSGNYAGQDSIYTICEGDINPINLWGLLGSGVDTLGNWTDFNSSGVDLGDSTSIDFSATPVGSYIFSYLLYDTTCSIELALITINIISMPNAGNDVNIFICDDDHISHDLEALLGSFDMGGLWSQTPSGIFDLSDVNDVYFDNVSSGAYEIKYLLDIGDACVADSAIFTINITAHPEAGIGDTITICIGTVIDLETLVSGANDVGVFMDTDGTGALSGSSFNSMGLLEGTYHFTYLVNGIAPCLDDEAFFTVIVTNGFTAGDDNSIQTCIGEVIYLQTLLNNEDQGGSFIDDDGSGFLLGDSIIILNNDISPLHFSYVIGGGDCPEDMATITVIIDPAPVFNWTINDTDLCEEECATLSIDNIGELPFDFEFQLYLNNSIIITQDLHKDDPNFEFTICNSDITSFVGDSIFLDRDLGTNWRIELSSFNDVNCIGAVNTVPSFDINFISDQIIVIDTSICGSIIIQDVLFDESHTMDTIIVDDLNACNIIYYINVDVEGVSYNWTKLDPECPDANGTFVINSVNGDPNDYTLIIDQVELPIDQTPYSIFIPVGEHEFVLENNNGCVSELTMFSIEEALPFDFSYTLDSINPTQMQFIGTTGASDYTVIWTPDDSIDCISCLDPIINLGETPTTYQLMIRYSLDCEYTLSFTIPARKKEEEPEPEPEDFNTIYIPNVFNPNQEPFYVTTKGPAIIDEFIVFDRWGNVLFNEQNIDSQSLVQGWDGTFRGAEVAPGVYVYMIKLTLNNIEKVKVGTLTLIR